MAPLPPGDLVIERARLVGTAGRGVLEAALARVAASDVAGGEEVLLVSRLRAHAPLSAHRSPGDFAARLTDQLRALRAEAAVDPRGPVSGAAALRFTSKARYAAWLAALWLDGPRQCAAGAAPEPAEIRAWLAREVLRDGCVLVATAVHLQRETRLAGWIARLAPSERAVAACAIEQAYAIPPAARAPIYPLSLLSPPTRSRPPLTASPRADRADHGPGPPPNEAALAASVRVLAMAWAELAAAEPLVHVLDTPGQRLALSLAVLARQPNLGRHLSPTLLERALAATPVAGPAETARQRQDREQPSPVARPVSRRSVLAPLVPQASKANAAQPGADVRQLPVEPSDPAMRIAEASPSPGPASRPARVDPPATRTEPGAPLPPEAVAASFGTAFGGVLFLLNPLLALGLYPDFTRPRDKGLEPSPFRLVDRLAVRLFGRDYRRDPLHRWLAACGLGGPLPPVWEADPRWLAGLPPGRHGFRAARTRTVLWDTRGFALVDAPRAPAWKRRGWLSRYRQCGEPADRLRPSRRRVPDDPDGRWVACLAEFLAARMVLAGVVDGPAALRLPGRVTVDEERVEVAFDLAALPIALRLAGLDRDPGWLPAEGRSISFRFD